MGELVHRLLGLLEIDGMDLAIELDGHHLTAVADESLDIGVGALAGWGVETGCRVKLLCMRSLVG